jgi:hypothetical protein
VKTEKLKICTAVWVFCLLNIVSAAVPQQNALIIGKIIAYRPFDRIGQAVSFVPNSELFLLKTEVGRRNTKPEFVKIQYRHFGFTDITDQILDEAPILTLKVKRDASCDQSYKEFLSSAPRVPVDGSTDNSGSVIFTERFKHTKLAPDYVLKCYVLEKGGFEVLRKN